MSKISQVKESLDKKNILCIIYAIQKGNYYMKHGYEGASAGELIRNYQISNDKIIINFLDGNIYEIPLTEKNETDLLNKMLVQAQLRNMKSSIEELKYDKKLSFNRTLISALVSGQSLSFGSLLYYCNQEIISKIAAFILGITSASTIIYSIKYILLTNEINELEKYDIYLQIKSKLENTNNPNLFNGIKKSKLITPLNINTLDNYSLNDIKKVRDNLEKCEQYQSYFDEDVDNQVLTKRNHNNK